MNIELSVLADEKKEMGVNPTWDRLRRFSFRRLLHCLPHSPTNFVIYLGHLGRSEIGPLSTTLSITTRRTPPTITRSTLLERWLCLPVSSGAGRADAWEKCPALLLPITTMTTMTQVRRHKRRPRS